MIAGADLFRFLLSAGGVTLLFLLGALWLQRSRASRLARRLILLVAVLYAFFSIYAIQYPLSRFLVGDLRPFQPGDVDAGGGRVAVVVLGSGSRTVEDWSGRRFSVVDRASAARVLEAHRVYQLIHPDVVVSSGGSPHPQLRIEPSGNTMRDALIALGVPRSQIVVETLSRTTRDEALVVASILKSLGIDRSVLVTSETHMRRSLGVFRSVGIRAVPAIAHEFEAPGSWVVDLLPSDDGITAADENVHEVLGLVYYRLRGWWAQ